MTVSQHFKSHRITKPFTKVSTLPSRLCFVKVTNLCLVFAVNFKILIPNQGPFRPQAFISGEKRKKLIWHQKWTKFTLKLLKNLMQKFCKKSCQKKEPGFFSRSRFFRTATITNRKKSFEKWEKSCSSAEIWPILVTMIPKRVPEWSYWIDTSSK